MYLEIDLISIISSQRYIEQSDQLNEREPRSQSRTLVEIESEGDTPREGNLWNALH